MHQVKIGVMTHRDKFEFVNELCSTMNREFAKKNGSGTQLLPGCRKYTYGSGVVNKACAIKPHPAHSALWVGLKRMILRSPDKRYPNLATRAAQVKH